MRGEGGAGELAQAVLDQVAQRAGPGRGGAPARGGGLDRPPRLGDQVSGGLQGGHGGVQVPGGEGLPGLGGGLDDDRDGSGRLSASVRLLALGSVASGSQGGLDRVGQLGGGLPVAGGAVQVEGLGGGAAGAAGIQVSAMSGRLPLTGSRCRPSRARAGPAGRRRR